MDDLVNSITRGNPSEVKIVLGGILAALAFYQAALMAVAYGKVRLPFLAPAPASRAHRAIGDTIVLVTLFVSFACIALFELDDDAALHIVSAIALLALLGVKIAVVRNWIGGGRYLPLLGISVLVLFVLTWASAAAGDLF